jgi:hypothetical protein
MFKYLIEGGHPLRGSLRASGNKNAALPCLAATLLTGEPVTLRNLPEIEDVQVMIEILRQLGTRAEKVGDHAWRLESGNPAPCAVPAELARQVRASILLAGPLLARCGKVSLPPPGGDVIGRRRLDTHFLALKELGAREEDRMKPKVLTSQLIKNISDHHAQLINKVRYGNMVLRGDTLYVLEVEPAGYAYYAANEAEKTAKVNIIEVLGFGAFGRVYIAGDEAEVIEARKIVEARLSGLDGRVIAANAARI